VTGHIRKRGGRWYVKLELGRDPITNKRRMKWYSGFKTRKAAEAELAKLINQVNTGAYVEPNRLTVGEYLPEVAGRLRKAERHRKNL